MSTELPQEEVVAPSQGNCLVRDSLLQVYNKSTLVKYGVDSLEWLASQPALAPYAKKATEATNPYLNLADERISKTVDNLQSQASVLKENVEGHVVTMKESMSVVKAKVSSLAVSDMYTTLMDEAWFARVNEILNDISVRVEQTLELTKVQVVDLYQSGKESLEKRVQGSPADKLYRAAGRLYIDFALAERVAESQEFLRSMKVRMGEQWNERLENPIREFLVRAKEATLPELMKMFKMTEEQSMNGLVGTSIGLIRYGQEHISTQWNNVLQATQDRVDSLLPEETPNTEESEIESESLTLGSVSRRLSKRVQARALAKMGQVKALSSERLSEMQHFDLVAYAETYLDGAKATVSPRLEQVAEQLQLVQSSLVQAQNSAVTRVTSGLEQAKSVAQEAAANAGKVIGSLQKNNQQRAQRLAERLRVRVSAAVVQVQSRMQSANLQALPNQVASFFLSLQDQVNQVATPELHKLLDAIKSLLSNVSDVPAGKLSECCTEISSAACCSSSVDANSEIEAVELGDSDEMSVDTTCGLDVEEPPMNTTYGMLDEPAEESELLAAEAASVSPEALVLETPVKAASVSLVEPEALIAETPVKAGSAKSRKKRSRKSKQ